MLKHAALVVLSCCLALGVWSTAFAAGDNTISKGFLDESKKFQNRVREAQATLKAEESLGQAEVCSYLRDTAWMVYKALDAYNLDKHNVPDDLQQLVTDGYLEFWPENPLNEWQPMKVLTVADGFHPGELVVQWAPAEFQSMVGPIENHILRPLSYEIAVYGWTEDAKPGDDAQPNAYNTWAAVPKGIVIMLGTYGEPASSTIAKIGKRLAKQAKQHDW